MVIARMKPNVLRRRVDGIICRVGAHETNRGNDQKDGIIPVPQVEYPRKLVTKPKASTWRSGLCGTADGSSL